MKAADGAEIKDEFDQPITSTVEAIWELRRELYSDRGRQISARFRARQDAEPQAPTEEGYAQKQIRTLSEAIAQRTGQTAQEVRDEQQAFIDDKGYDIQEARYSMPRSLSRMDRSKLDALEVGDRPTPTQQKILEDQFRLEPYSGGNHHIDRYLGDRQRERLYKAERKAMPDFFTRDYDDVSEAQKAADEIQHSDWWKENFPRAKRVKVLKERAANQRAANGDGYNGEISLPDHMLSRHVLVHEMAHIASGGSVEGHGPQFAKNYHDMVAEFIGAEEAKRLADEFGTGKVTMAPKPGTAFADRETMIAFNKLSLTFTGAEQLVKDLRRRLRDSGLDHDHPDYIQEKADLKAAEKLLAGYRKVLQEIIKDGQFVVGKDGFSPLFKRLRTHHA